MNNVDKPKHTPGPWVVTGYAVAVWNEGTAEHVCFLYHDNDEDIRRANAELIARAPEMAARIIQLEAQVAAWLDHDGERKTLFCACKAAIEVIADLDAEETSEVFTKLLNAIRLVEPGFNVTESD